MNPTSQVRNRPGKTRGTARCAAALLALLLSTVATLAADRLVLTVDAIPADRLVVAPVDWAAAAQACALTMPPAQVRVRAEPEGHLLPAQFVPDPDRSERGVLVVRWEVGASNRAYLDFAAPSPAAASSRASGSGTTEPRGFAITRPTEVRTPWYTVLHDPRRMGGLPAEWTFGGSRQKFESLLWNDRLYHREHGQFWLRHDPEPKVERIADGPLVTVMRVSSRYTQPGRPPPASHPAAVYDWFYSHDQPLVFVRAHLRQEPGPAWHEAHFLELGYTTNAFAQWTGGEPRRSGVFTAAEQTHAFNRWGAISDGSNTIGLFHAGQVMVYDGRGYGRYLHADADTAWRAWESAAQERSAWFWIGTNGQPATALAAVAESRAEEPRVTLRPERLEARIAAVRRQLAQAPVADRSSIGWQLVTLQLLEQHGRFREALEFAPGQVPPEWRVVAAGDLRLVLDHRADGLALVSLADAATGTLLADGRTGPLFEITLRAAGATQETRVTAERGWARVDVEAGAGAGEWTLRWHEPRPAPGGTEPGAGSSPPVVGALTVTLRVRADADQHRLAWTGSVHGQAAPWSVAQLRFPQLVLMAPGASTQLLLPQAAGVLRAVGREPLAKFYGEYPSGWMTMQLAALYDPATRTGLYFGLHDPLGSTKQFTAEPATAGRAVRLAWDIPAPDIGRAGNRADVPGEAVWQLLRGDWFDAALVYRAWARADAHWFPSLGPEGRADTPAWMRELCAWAMTGGAPDACVPAVLEFRRALGVPVGFHWYSWHQIPFDNDYPHYFPTREGFRAGVAQLHAGGVAVMPYINGRLWDTRDRGAGDFEFAQLARPAATKDARGEPIVESYGSQETNGEPVRLAVMCPATRLWRERQQTIVRRLLQEEGVQGVYLDQIAAAKSVLCFDPAHGHPLGGGHWWNQEGYWPMLDGIRRAKPAETMLTTECNAEPFLRWFDGYLTWHWQYDGQVPLFPAVYGGAVQMFGRAYRGGATKDLALRMKAAQQLVWGEQLGWLDPHLVRETNNFAFFREAVRLRWNLRRYFHAGEMARPPALSGSIPSVTADWQWSGTWPVTTSALLAGAWRLPRDRSFVVLFANVSDQAIAATVDYDTGALGAPSWTRRRWTAEGSTELDRIGTTLHETMTIAPRALWAWEMRVIE